MKKIYTKKGARSLTVDRSHLYVAIVAAAAVCSGSYIHMAATSANRELDENMAHMSRPIIAHPAHEVMAKRSPVAR